MEKGDAEEDVFNQGFAPPASDNNISVHAPYERKHPIACPTDAFSYEVQILVNQSCQGCDSL